jgi:serine protease AprX
MIAHSARWTLVVLSLFFARAWPASAAAIPGREDAKLSAKTREEAKNKSKVDVLVRFRRSPSAADHLVVNRFGGRVRLGHRSRWLAVQLPGTAVKALADNPAVEYVATDAPIQATMSVARAAAGYPLKAHPESSLKGSGVTIAMIDSGVARHGEIQTLVAAVDLVGHYATKFKPENSVDPNGHGTLVAGIMVGDGGHSKDKRFAGVAPEAHLVSLRVLDDAGRGLTSDMLAALDWVLAYKDRYDIRVVNISVGHPVYEPAAEDPLVQAVDALWDAGVVVVCSAGNGGRSGHGTISSPCNSRKVITVGALNDRNTLTVTDDAVATYSSRGPTAIDRVAKPDLIAPGNRIVSTRAPGSHHDTISPDRRKAGDPGAPLVYEHFEMSGTSVAAPMVSGAVALMLQQEPWLNPATVKARLMLSAKKPTVGDPFATGAGVLDILGALRSGGEVAVAPSPLASADISAGVLRIENTGALWSNPAFSLPALWSDAVLWSEASVEADTLSSYASLRSDTAGSALLWPEATLWSEAMLWPESTLWSESVLWSDEPVGGVIGALGDLVDDP